MDFGKFFKRKADAPAEGQHDLFCDGVDGKPTCIGFMNELTNDDSTPAEVQDIMREWAKADGLSVEDTNYFYG